MVFFKFSCIDGFIVIGIAENDVEAWTKYCELLGLRDSVSQIENSSLFNHWLEENRTNLGRQSLKWFAERTCSEALELLGGINIPSSKVQSPEEVAVDPQLRARGMIVKVYNPDVDQEVEMVGSPFRMSVSDGEIKRAYPALGEHTDEILSSLLNYSKNEIDNLRGDNVLSMSPIDEALS